MMSTLFTSTLRSPLKCRHTGLRSVDQRQRQGCSKHPAWMVRHPFPPKTPLDTVLAAVTLSPQLDCPSARFSWLTIMVWLFFNIVHTHGILLAVAAGGQLIPSIPDMVSTAVPDPFCFSYGTAVSVSANLGTRRGNTCRASRASKTKTTRQQCPSVVEHSARLFPHRTEARLLTPSFGPGIGMPLRH